LPDLAAVYSKHQAEGLTILGVDDEQVETVSGFVASNFIPYPILLDLNGRVTRMYRVNAIPTTFVIDRRGTLRAVLSGSRSSSAFEQAILPLLIEKP
jgi:cytochrome c biogenesis protein CcmG/thiol:disulfide interchange protein DsbE